MPSRIPNPKIIFTPEQKLFICKLHGEFHTGTEIRENLKKEFNIVLENNQAIWHVLYEKGTQQYIKKFREEFILKVNEIPITHKKVRLDRLEKIYKLFELKMLDKTQKAFWKVSSATDKCLKALEQARDEVERHPALMEFYQMNNYQGEMTDEEFRKRRNDILDRLRDFKAAPPDRGIGLDRESAEGAQEGQSS